ncbi:hypothetical protein [Rathayibacter toxicus]|uniref:hypothetical protein n=2 Tax=Rathayibacter toxicus TaxID=145458 RepID=UPI001C044198|nr:hypothetical protein [Rathayibacter toxicus]
MPTNSYRPRAVGRVFVHRGSQTTTIPMTGPGSPANGARVCTSGMMTGFNCTFTAAPAPQNWHDVSPHQRAAHTDGPNIDIGDLGSPLTNEEGTFFGVVTDKGHPNTPEEHLISWTPAETIFREYPGYFLAPS